MFTVAPWVPSSSPVSIIPFQLPVWLCFTLSSWVKSALGRHQLYNLWSSVQNENVGSFIQKLRISRQWQQALNQVQVLLSAGPCTTAQVHTAMKPTCTEDARIWTPSDLKEESLFLDIPLFSGGEIDSGWPSDWLLQRKGRFFFSEEF